ncbi:MAG: hypothetical protein AAGA80_05280 [Cyanobacteria bacterium P01_F01_bin.143]
MPPDENYIRKHALRVKNPETEGQRKNSMWRIASNCDFEQKYDDFSLEDDTLTGAQETEVMEIIDESLNIILKAELNGLAWELASMSGYVFPEKFDFFSSNNSRAQHFKRLAVRAFEVIQKVRIDDND